MLSQWNSRTFLPQQRSKPRKELSWTQMHEQKSCQFLSRLPAEIRNMIYVYVFEETGMWDEEERASNSGPEELDIQGRPQTANTSTASSTTSPTAMQSLFTPAPPAPSTPSLFTTETRDTYLTRNANTTSCACPSHRPGHPHPLSLLQTCRKIYTEAALLAFATHTFTTASKHHTTFHALRSSVAHLSASQTSALSRLAFDLGTEYTAQSRRASDFLTNCLLLFPAVTRLELRGCRRGVVHPNACHAYDPMNAPYATHARTFDERWKEDAVRRYVPRWLHTALGDVLEGRAYRWQKGERWAVSYPQMELPAAAFCVQSVWEDGLGWVEKTVMDADVVGRFRGVERCACGCGEVSWVLAELRQEGDRGVEGKEGGRKVEVEVVFYGDSAVQRERERRGLCVRLREGCRLDGVEAVSGGSGYVYDANAAYWERLRERKRKKGAIVRWWDGFGSGAVREG